MTDGDALYGAILAHPAEDTPRLMYADYLDELGGKHNAGRAKFIRLCVAGERDGGATWFTNRTRDEAGWATKTLLRNWKEYMRLPDIWQPIPPHISIPRMVWRNDYIRSQHAAGVWYPPPPNSQPVWGIYPNNIGFCRLFFRRGFVSAVYCHWNFWRDFGDVVVAHEPISHVELTTVPLITEGDAGTDRNIFVFRGEEGKRILSGRAVEALAGSDRSPEALAHAMLMLRWPTVADWQLPKSAPVTA